MASKFKPGTLPDHGSCTVHRTYMLGCEQYEHLLTRSGQRCEICGRPGLECTRGKLAIDHLGPRWAVRGLLCHICNAHLTAKVWPTAAWAAEYIASTWWIAECRKVGVATMIRPEPDHGSAIRDQWDVVWLREGDGLWRPRGRGRPGITSASWRWLFDHRGPQNMALIDLDAEAERGSWLVNDAERAALQSLVTLAGGDLPRMRRDLRDRRRPEGRALMNY